MANNSLSPAMHTAIADLRTHFSHDDVTQAVLGQLNGEGRLLVGGSARGTIWRQTAAALERRGIVKVTRGRGAGGTTWTRIKREHFWPDDAISQLGALVNEGRTAV